MDNTLESAVAGERVAQLIAKTEQLLRQRAFLRDERRRLRASTEQIDERKKALSTMQRSDWVHESVKDHLTDRHVRINIGGLMYESSVKVLSRDPHSLLAQLCGSNPPVLADPEGDFFYFDRDWWLFRYVLAFLRDGTLPEDRQLLAQLYREAGFWNLKQMQRAIEEEKLHLRSVLTDTKDDKNLWWKKLPSWWQAVDEAKAKEKADKEAKAKKEDWWKDTSYKGKTFLAKEEMIENLTPTTFTWEVPPIKKETNTERGSSKMWS